jgi:hypothetical protein
VRSVIVYRGVVVASSPSSNSMDEMRLGEIDLLAKMADVSLENPRVPAEVVIPYVIQDLRAGKDPARIEH